MSEGELNPLPPEPPIDGPEKKSKSDFFKSPDIPYPAGAPEQRQWAVAIHASGFAGLVFPFGNILAPLILWMIKKPEGAYLDEIGKEVVNFHISFSIYAVVSILAAILLSCLIIPIILPFVVGIGGIVLMILAIVKTSNGEDYRYPATIRFIK